MLSTYLPIQLSEEETKKLCEDSIKKIGVKIATVNLSVGAGTFQPVKVENIEEHDIHSEFLEVSADVVDMVIATKKAGKKVFAVGTTAIRALETAFNDESEKGFSGYTKLFIYPGYKFKVVDMLITNFHLPQSSLLMLDGIEKSIDVIVPRGGKSLVAMVEKEAQVPVFGHLEGICHIYIDKNSDEEKAINVCINAKMRRPGICGAVETILVHKDIAKSLLPTLINALNAQACEVRGCEKTMHYSDSITNANDSDWSTEYLLPIVSIKIVDDIDEAIGHIDTFSSGHTESIITEDLNNASRFQIELDSAIVMHNTSTQFADGGEFGLGGEIGIATGKFHARGPVGVDQLTSFKYLVNGNGHIRP